jgi:hypothetical protein
MLLVMPRNTVDELLDAYDENADYEESGSTTKAAAFATACRRLCTLPVESMQGNRHRVVMKPELYRELAAEARAWINSHSTAGSVSHADLRSLR